MKNKLLSFLSSFAFGMIAYNRNQFLDGFSLAWYNIGHDNLKAGDIVQ